MRATRLLGGLAAVLFFVSVIPVASSSPVPPDATQILWDDYCARHPENTLCLPVPTATPTPTIAPTATPTIAPTATPTVAPTPAPTVTPTAGVIGAVPASGTGPLVCPAGYINWESRGWWTPAGESFDQYRGVDAEICWPVNEHLASGTTTFTLHIQLRRLHAPIRFVRIGFGPDGSVNGFYRNVTFTPDAAGYGEWYMTAPLTANTHAGYNEYRLTANVPSDEDGVRQYQSTGLQAWTTSSTSSYRTRPWWESRGWYEDTDYVNNRMHTVPVSAPVRGTYSFRWECTRTGTGTVNYHVVYVDADTHAIPMVLPRKYAEGTGGFSGTVSIDTTALSNGRHKVLTRCDDHVSTGTTSALTQTLITVAN